MEHTELTGQQAVSIVSEGALTNVMPASYVTYRAMRRHPTIALTRALTSAPIVAASWSLIHKDEATDEMIELIESLQDLRSMYIERSLLGGIDFGWQPFEKVFVKGEKYITIKKLKPLLQDITDIMIDGNGAFKGFKQKEVLPIESSLLVPWRVEGTAWYGSSLLENARIAYSSWVDSDASAARYDKGIAGAKYVIYYPVGSTEIDGADKDNLEIAKGILQTLDGTKVGIAMPLKIVKMVDDLNALASFQQAWRLDILSDLSPKQPGFIQRNEYLDKLLVRAMLWPERAVMEGKFGTKAEASVHTDAALTHAELQHQFLTTIFNWYVVDQLLVMNFGEGTNGLVRFEAAPILDEKQLLFRKVFFEIFKDPTGFADLITTIDSEAIVDALGLPKIPLEEREKLVADVEIIKRLTDGSEPKET